MTPIIFSPFKADVMNGVHNLATATLKYALTNTAPSLANAILADITQIGAAGGYAPATVAVTSSSQSGGTYSLVLGAVTFTATGAAFNNFRYIVLYNDTAASDNLIGYLDAGATVALASGQSWPIASGTFLTNA